MVCTNNVIRDCVSNVFELFGERSEYSVFCHARHVLHRNHIRLRGPDNARKVVEELPLTIAPTPALSVAASVD
jgi:hypothetical protein